MLDTREIFKQVRANQVLLDSCKLHSWIDDPKDDSVIWKKKICMRCGGRVDSSQARWYEKGIEHAWASSRA